MKRSGETSGRRPTELVVALYIHVMGLLILSLFSRNIVRRGSQSGSNIPHFGHMPANAEIGKVESKFPVSGFNRVACHRRRLQTPWDSPCKPVFNRALSLVRRAICKGRAMIWGLHTASPAPDSLGQAFSNLLHEVTPCRGVSLRIFILGSARALNPAIQEQLFLIGREAVMNALRHSTATKIEVEVQYLRDVLCLFVRDNGCGINPDEIQKVRNSLWALRGMRDRAENIRAQFGIWSRPGAGTEVRVAVAVDVAVPPA